MVHRDYRKEVGVVSSKKSVPKLVAIIVLAAVAVVITYSVTHVLAAAKKHEKAAAAGPATPAD